MMFSFVRIVRQHGRWIEISIHQYYINKYIIAIDSRCPIETLAMSVYER